jgi:hypothetical protein
MAYRTWTDEQLIESISTSSTISEVVRKVGLKSCNSGNHQTIRRKINELQIDTSHFHENSYGKINNTPRKLSDILVENSTYVSTKNLKNKLINLHYFDDKCAECGLINWKGKKLSLHLDHINGVNNDHRIENLRLLCPNCHSLTPTYCRGTRQKKKYNCPDCGCEIAKKSLKCNKCDGKLKQQKDSLTKIKWPPIDKLIALVNENNYVQVGRMLGVSDNAVRKRIQTRPCTTTTKER